MEEVTAVYRGSNDQYIYFELDNPFRVILEPDKRYRIVEHKEKRTLQQNKYIWVLIDMLDKKINGFVPDEMSIYRNLIKRAKIRTEIIMATEEARDKMLASGVFRVIEKIEERTTGKGKGIVYRCYYGTSTFSKDEMSDFIESLLLECELNGINTDPYLEALGVGARRVNSG